MLVIILKISICLSVKWLLLMIALRSGDPKETTGFVR